MARLIIYEEADNETVFETFELTDNNILIGSDPDNHLILDTPYIDPSHASLELRSNHWIIQDLGSPGGTAVNGHEIDGPHRLYHDDIIELGVIKLKFYDPERSVTKEMPLMTAAEEVEFIVENDEAETEVQVSGRVWFATIATTTLVVIFIIIFLLIVAHFLQIINIGDLLPPWLSL